MKKLIALFLALTMVLSLSAFALADGEVISDVEDTITIVAPPIITGYTDFLAGWIEEFNVMYPNLHIEVIPSSWDDNVSRLTQQALSGDAPDIGNIECQTLGTYVEMGVAIDIRDYMPEGRLDDYDESVLGYMTLDDTLYGLPLYVSIQAMGGNKAMLEAAGVDVEKVQNEGWSYDEFLAAIEKGTTEDTYGFVFANAGITTTDFVHIFGTVAGLTNDFTEDLKYAYTSENMLMLLEGIEEVISSGWMPNYGVEAGTRLVMLETGECMITGKAMPLFEANVKNNLAGLADGTAVEGTIEMEYVFLPCPIMDGATETTYGMANAFLPLRNNNTTDEHLKNVMLFLDFICSGERAAKTAGDCYLSAVCETGREAQASMTLDQSEGNAAAAARAVSLVVAPPSGVTGEQSGNANTIMNEVIVPKMQALIAGETTAQEMYDTICQEAFAVFGEEGCETGFIA